MSIETLAANMHAAFLDRNGATIGGGEFTPEELKEGAIALSAFPELLNALQSCHRTLRKQGYDMTQIDAAIEKATA